MGWGTRFYLIDGRTTTTTLRQLPMSYRALDHGEIGDRKRAKKSMLWWSQLGTTLTSLLWGVVPQAPGRRAALLPLVVLWADPAAAWPALWCHHDSHAGDLRGESGGLLGVSERIHGGREMEWWTVRQTDRFAKQEANFGASRCVHAHPAIRPLKRAFVLYNFR
jgi:hypothetical protein